MRPMPWGTRAWALEDPDGNLNSQASPGAEDSTAALTPRMRLKQQKQQRARAKARDLLKALHNGGSENSSRIRRLHRWFQYNASVGKCLEQVYIAMLPDNTAPPEEDTRFVAGTRLILPISATKEFIRQQYGCPVHVRVTAVGSGLQTHCGVLRFATQDLEEISRLTSEEEAELGRRERSQMWQLRTMGPQLSLDQASTLLEPMTLNCIMSERLFGRLDLTPGLPVMVESVELRPASTVKVRPAAIQDVALLYSSLVDLLREHIYKSYACLTVHPSLLYCLWLQRAGSGVAPCASQLAVLQCCC